MRITVSDAVDRAEILLYGVSLSCEIAVLLLLLLYTYLLTILLTCLVLRLQIRRAPTADWRQIVSTEHSAVLCQSASVVGLAAQSI